MKTMKRFVLAVLVCGLMAGSVSAAGFTSTFDAAGDGWVEVGGSNHAYGVDLSPLGWVTAATGATFDGVGNLNRAGLALPPAGETASWYAKMGPWNGDSFMFCGIGDGGGGVPTEYAFTYNADDDTTSVRIGGVTVASGTVGGKTYGLYEIALANVAGTITATMTLTDINTSTVLLSGGGTRAYDAASMSSQIVSDWGGKKIFVDEVGYSVTPEPATMILLGLGGLLIRRRRAQFSTRLVLYEKETE